MITGHLGVAAAVRSRWPGLSVLWLVPVAVAPDILDFAYVALGICSPYGLYSHTVPAAALTGAVLGGIAFLVTGSRSAGLVTAGVVLAHLPLDLVTGHKIFWPGGPLLGFSLYRRPLLDFLIELPIALAGWWVLRRSGRGPSWATVGAAALALALAQATFDVLPQVKPSACRGIVQEVP
ncbi:MAG: hypothetical protein HOQ17_10530 [Gemmatimonadaceae bacterium]|nr:hypothetical protein [Gemmatimonadaceae bacterium]NUO95520.1 hypothetical protein [Gemmatimonadaceae bacterium]NUP57386.1 hypothetical protein [Gemmatimonadaceae bacterium]NUP69639.1 hypothetical protein [Gemmatimonadaceae bacterium]NUR36024.1 hypothetical protein [Gemmatimonadaceae bacterium]